MYTSKIPPSHPQKKITKKQIKNKQKDKKQKNKKHRIKWKLDSGLTKQSVFELIFFDIIVGETDTFML